MSERNIKIRDFLERHIETIHMCWILISIVLFALVLLGGAGIIAYLLMLIITK